MTPTNKTIYTALITTLNGAALGYPVAYPGYNFTPPDTGAWLEVNFLPNRGIDDGLANNSDVAPQGIFQVMAASRPGAGLDAVQQAAQAVIGTFPKGTTVSGLVRIQRHPYQGSAMKEDDRLMIPVTIEYSA